jgi:hypothetical protein
LRIDIDVPSAGRARLLVEVKRLVERRDIPRLIKQLQAWTSTPGDVPVIAARYLSPSVREALTEEGLSWVDATGNMRIMVERPAVFISDRGEDRDPWRRGRPRGTLKGEPAARVVRALLDYRRGWRVRDLIATSGTSSGATYRVLDYLQREDLIVKNDALYQVTDWERLLRAWSLDTPLDSATRTMAFIDSRGVSHLLSTLSKDWWFPYAVTGSVAVQEWAPYAPSKAAYVYVSSIQEAATQWNLRVNVAAPNAILLEPATVGDVPFVNTVMTEAGYTIAAPPQVAADLLSGPGREPAEGEFLIEWMKANEERWRRD